MPERHIKHRGGEYTGSYQYRAHHRYGYRTMETGVTALYHAIAQRKAIMANLWNISHGKGRYHKPKKHKTNLRVKGKKAPLHRRSHHKTYISPSLL